MVPESIDALRADVVKHRLFVIWCQYPSMLYVLTWSSIG